jgi:CBS domain-containing protein
MQVKNIMSSPVFEVTPDTSIARVIDLMVGERISGLPVVDASEALVGIVSEGDLIRRAEVGTATCRFNWLECLAAPSWLAERYALAHGSKVGEIMTRDVKTVSETASLPEAARIMGRHGVKRLPVTRDGRVIGIVTRADLVRALGAVLASSDDPDQSARVASPFSERH